MGLQKIFALDSTPYEEELFQPLNELYRTNEDRVLRFWQELLEVPGYLNLKSEHSEIIESVFASRPGERPPTFSCMSLRLDDICALQDFIMNHRDLFTPKNAKSAKILLDDLDFVNKQSNIFDAKPIAVKSVFTVIPEPLVKVEKMYGNTIYFFMYRQKEIKLTSRKDIIAKFSEDVHDRILFKNVKFMMLEMPSLLTVKSHIRDRNNLFEIRKALTLHQERL